MKITKAVTYSQILNYAFFKYAIIKFKDGHKKKYFILDVSPAEDGNESGEDEVVYMTAHSLDPEGLPIYAGDGIPVSKIDEIKVIGDSKTLKP